MPTASVVASRRLSDPLTAALQPPSDETEVQRDARLASEREAKKISDSIDEQLRQEKVALKAKAKSRREIKVLLLRQSESGKSITLKLPVSVRAQRLSTRVTLLASRCPFQLRALRGQLQPLAELEEQLVKCLSSGDEDEATHFASTPRTNPKAEVTINNRVNWKRALNKFTSRNNAG